MNLNNMHFGEGNLRSVANDTFQYLTWSLPSRTTCPFSCESCRKRCFAKKNESFKAVLKSRTNNFEESKKDTFVNNTIELIDKYISKKKCLGKLVIVRIHTSGDFYSKTYLEKWIKIANKYKEDRRIQFQSYTKSIPYLDGLDLASVNIHFVYSKWDDSPKEHVELAQKMGLPIFYATSRSNVETARTEGEIYICPKSSDGTCKECYKNNHKLIMVSYH